jgi:hypothetical protein
VRRDDHGQRKHGWVERIDQVDSLIIIEPNTARQRFYQKPENPINC